MRTGAPIAIPSAGFASVKRDTTMFWITYWLKKTDTLLAVYLYFLWTKGYI